MASRWAARALAVIVAMATVPAGSAAGQDGCLPDLEPNDDESTSSSFLGPGCVEGTLPGGDQDLILWEVPPQDAAARWAIDVEGQRGSLTTVQLFPVVTDPGVEPLRAERQPILEVTVPPDGSTIASSGPVIVPVGRYLIGAVRGVPAGSPDVGGGPYRIEIRRDPLAGTPEQEPNDSADEAMAVAGDFAIFGDLQGSTDRYRWSVPEAESWQLALDVPLGAQARLELATSDGTALDLALDEDGAQALDLVLEAGDYTLEVGPRTNEPTPYLLQAVAGPLEGDAESNDGPERATDLELSEPAWGRLVGRADVDHFGLTIPSGPETLVDARLVWRSRATRSLCLLDEAGEDRLCRRGEGGVQLRDLALGPGQHVFEVSGVDDAEDFYLLRIDPTTAVEADFESEPNDDVAVADSIDPRLGMRARGGEGDVDVFALRTSDAPQVWDVDIEGSALRQVELIQPSGRQLAVATVSPDGRSARLADLQLTPGDHWLRVRSGSGDYQLSATPLGPPDPEGEREPNDDEERADPYVVGDRLVGRLPLLSDHDYLRITAAGPQRVRFDLQPPDDGSVGMRLWSGGAQVATLDPGSPGAAVSWDLWLVPGDHHLELVPAQASEGFYELTSERLDPFAGGVDREPNDDPAWASAVPPSLRWSGAAADTRDEDWYALPPTASDEPIVLQLEGEDIRVRAEQSLPGSGQETVRFDRGADGAFASVTPLAVGGRVAVGITASGPYDVAATGAGWQALPAPAELPLELAWRLPVEGIAAYWPEAQYIDAAVTLSNTGDDDLEVELETTTSHYLWSTPPAMDVLVPAGETVSVAVPVNVGPDAWGTEDVQLATRATATDGGMVSATATVAVSPDAAAIAPRAGWSVPPALLGGINVAALALGAEPAGTIDLDEERRLFDGVTPEGSTGQADQDYGNGFGVAVSDLDGGMPLELIVDLAGEQPVPVAGTIINPEASEGRLREVPRDFELLLSTDGTTWRPALEGTLSPLRLDQAFALDEPMAATHAMLRIHSKYVDPRTSIALGEWKVIAEPGFDLGAAGRDIARPTLGGHVVTFQPFDDDPDVAERILEAGSERDVVAVAGAHELGITLGFADDRAARIERLEWRDPAPTVSGQRLEIVDVHASLDAPGGPWHFLGTWALERGNDGSVPAFELDEPEWARYLRLRGRIPRGAEEIELPGSLAVFESPADQTYRSIVGEWGYRASTGPREWLTEDDRPSTAVEDAGDELASATPLTAGELTFERVTIGSDIDWYSLAVPDGHDTLDIVVDGHPFVGVALTLVDAAGAEIEMPFRIAPDGTVHYRAHVEAGERYAVRVEQPPFSVAFAFDTSPSMVPFIDRVTEGVRSFLSEVRPGREVAVLLPFDEPPILDDWSDDRYRLQDAFENHVAEGGSSSAESALISASGLLAEREGARAILLVTDAETSSYERTPELWDELTRVRPVIFSVHVGGLVEPVASRRRMQDWAQSGGGSYTYPVTAGEMDQAFERMATWLRRPATYALRYETLGLQPATLALVSPADGGGEASSALPLAPGVGVEVILDTSGSMRKRLGGKRRLEVAKSALRQLLQQTLAEGTPLTLRTFGGPGKGRAANCATGQVLPLAPLERDVALRAVKQLQAAPKTGTPIATALDAVADDLAAVSGLRHVVLISDGAASCDGDPLASIEALRAAGVEVKVDVVGFALDDEAVKAEMAVWATAGGGRYYDANDAKALARSISTALQAPYRASAVDGSSSATGAIDGPPLELAPGTYRIEVLTEPPTYIDEVELESGASQVLTIELGTDEP